MLDFPMGYVMGFDVPSYENLWTFAIRTKQTNSKVITMGSFYVSGLMRNCVLCTTTITLISGSVCPPILAAYEYDAQFKGVNIDLNDIAFIVRLEKLYEKAKRYKEKLESEKLIEVMYEIKLEVEGYTGKHIDLDAHIDAVEREAKKQGAKFKSGEVKQVKKDLKKAGKKYRHKTMFLYECNMYGIEFNQTDCDLHFESLMMAKHSRGSGKEDEKKVKVPIRISIGITASLCGYFLGFIPHPIAQTASKFLIATGLGLCVDGTVNRLEEDEKKEQDRQ